MIYLTGKEMSKINTNNEKLIKNLNGVQINYTYRREISPQTTRERNFERNLRIRSKLAKLSSLKAV